jgi:carbonic anhydrase/acetyltransferase-like protein (isoleucine patch superfamily)
LGGVIFQLFLGDKAAGYEGKERHRKVGLHQSSRLVHTSHGMNPATVGEDVTVGHRAIIHGCTIEDRCLIGMGATILDNAVIGEGSIVGAHTLVTKGTIVPPGSLVMGTPGKVIRPLNPEETKSLLASAKGYQDLGAYYRTILPR